MKISALLLLLSIFAIVSCTPTMKPVENAKPMETPKPIVENSKLAEGKNIFTTSCAKCHDLPNPKDYNDTEWVNWVQKMAVKAKIDAKQEKLVYEYITSEN